MYRWTIAVPDTPLPNNACCRVKACVTCDFDLAMGKTETQTSKHGSLRDVCCASPAEIVDGIPTSPLGTVVCNGAKGSQCMSVFGHVGHNSLFLTAISGRESKRLANAVPPITAPDDVSYNDASTVGEMRRAECAVLVEFVAG